jgi:hypothetical protein
MCTIRDEALPSIFHFTSGGDHQRPAALQGEQ